jgi:type I restriction enzyme S subunit
MVELQTGPFGTQLHAHDYVAHGIPVVPTEAIRGRQIDRSVLPMISFPKAAELERHKLKPGDILFARRGVQATGHIGYVRDDEAGFICGTGAIRLRVAENNSTISSEFLSHVFANPASIQWFKFHAIGATMPNLNEGIIRAFPLSIPPVEEQKAIALLLSALDDKIELNRRISQTLEAMAQAIFKDWFIDFGPTRAKAEGLAPYLAPDTWALFPDRLDHEDRPEGWSERRVEDVLELAYGKALPANERIEGYVPVYGSGGITGYHNTPLIHGPSVIVGRKGTVGSLYWEDGPFFPIDTVFYVKPRAPLTFCFYLLLTLGLEAMNTDAAVPGLNRSNVYRLLVPWAPDDVRLAFDDLASPLRRTMQANSNEARTLAATRDVLLPKLMSGEIRVRDADKIVQAVA